MTEKTMADYAADIMSAAAAPNVYFPLEPAIREQLDRIEAALDRLVPKPLEVGDRVTHPRVTGEVRILAIDGDDAWCRRDDGFRAVIPMAGMERVS